MSCSCPQCGLFVATRVFTHTGGDCQRCGRHVPPRWYLDRIRALEEARDELHPEYLYRAWTETDQVQTGWTWLSQIELELFIETQFGLSLPWDQGKKYFPPYGEGPEYGTVDVTPELALRLSGRRGVDDVHNALLIVSGSVAGAVGKSHVAQWCANTCYYMATSLFVGVAGGMKNGRRHLTPEERVESELRDLASRRVLTLQEGVRYAFEAFGLPHTTSWAYRMKGVSHLPEYEFVQAGRSLI